jgi:formamidopyrimidine-DNA glycosylase
MLTNMSNDRARRNDCLLLTNGLTLEFHDMPELPEVETMVRGIRTNCIGRRIVRTVYPPCPRKPIKISPNRRLFAQQTKGRIIIDIRRLAKRVILGLDSGYSIVVEPRMTGLMLLADPPTQEHRRVCFELSHAQKKAPRLEFWDRRGLGTISLLAPELLRSLESRLGTDALDLPLPDWTLILSRTMREIKIVLLDQTIVAGIGNLYASEILHESRISPFAAASSLSKQQVRRLMNATNRILHEAIAYEGSTLGDGTYRNALNKDGSYQNHHIVYQRADIQCLSCGKATIKRVLQAQRATFFCPRCQQ